MIRFERKLRITAFMLIKKGIPQFAYDEISNYIHYMKKTLK